MQEWRQTHPGSTLLRNYAILAEVTAKNYSAPDALAKIRSLFDVANDGLALRTLLESTETVGYATSGG